MEVMEKKILYNGLNDPQFACPYVDVDEWREQPIRHHYIHGGFENTLTKFCFYFPEESVYEKRFYQFLSPFVGDECEAQNQEGAEDKISFAIGHGAYLVETNLGGIVNGGDDPTLMYRASASSAQYSRQIATKLYGEHRPYGYVYGGSGGGFKTISCMESTEGVWDGAVPFVIGSPMAMPYVFTARVHAMRILRHKMTQIVDALEPGGSGNPYEGLNEEEAAALREATLMGFPLRTWCVYHTIGDGALPVLTPAVEAMDPAYYQDFWEIPGYLGAEEGSSAGRDRIQLKTTVSEILTPQGVLKGVGDSIDEKNAYGVDEAWKNQMNKAVELPYFRLRDFPSEDSYLRGLKLKFLTGALAGQVFAVVWVRDSIVTVDNSMDSRDLFTLLEQADVGDEVMLDNSDYIALQTYHRHQVPGEEYTSWDQFRDEDGKPLYPQRNFLVGPVISASGAGSVQSGTPNGKIIVLESLMDESAFPWQADWYRRMVEKNAGGNADDRFRLWYMDNCMHTDCEEGNGGDHQHIVSYLGALYQALLDVSAWVEKGVEPAPNSRYRLDGGQVVIPEKAKERRGIQPVVELNVEGEKCAKVRVGETVVLTAEIELPDGAGTVEEVRWDFEGTNCFAEGGIMTPDDREAETGARAVNAHVFEKPGIYFPVVKVSSNRTPGDAFTKVMNQDRVRIIVEQ